MISLHELLYRINLGDTVDAEVYEWQRNLVRRRIDISYDFMPDIPALIDAELTNIRRLDALMEEYTAIEGGKIPDRETVQQLLPIVDDMVVVNREILHTRRQAGDIVYHDTIKATQQLQIVQIVTLVFFLILGILFFWMTRKTFKADIEMVRAYARQSERYALRIAEVNRFSLVMSSHLNQTEILDIAAQEIARLFDIEHVSIVLFDVQQQIGTLVAEYPLTQLHGLQITLPADPSSQQLLHSEQAIVIEGATTDPRTSVIHDILVASDVGSLMLAPLLNRGCTIGLISLESVHHQRTFTREEQDLIVTIATAVAAAVENARLFEAEQIAHIRAETLGEIARVISSSFDLDEVLRLILEELCKVIAYDKASIMLLDDHQTLRVAAFQIDHQPSVSVNGIGQQEYVNLKPGQHSAARIVLEQRTAMLIDDTRLSLHWFQAQTTHEIRSWLGVPLLLGGNSLGVLNINAFEPHQFDTNDLDVALTFANHAAVALEKAQLYRESVTRIEQEMAIAGQIQRQLFPRALPQLDGITLSVFCQPARETGGDFYDVLRLNDGRMGIMVGDASGKSIPGAMLMAIARSTARSAAYNHTRSEAVVAEINRLIVDDVPSFSFVALCYAIFHLGSASLALSNAGQLSPIVRRADGSLEYLEMHGPTLPLGMVMDVAYQSIECQLATGDTVIFYTDGVVEAQTGDHQLFGFERWEGLIRQYGHLPPQAFIERVNQEIADFVGSVPQHDDITLLVLRVDELPGPVH
ncbi:MAG: SpoIIE family protein phosphatase [Chloroflexaceae bacterium]|nr:SpoIIE family protein phosphatase [Chloroflexaceae bacterium]